MVRMNLSAKQKQRCRCKEQMYGHLGGEGENGKNWEIGIDLYTLRIKLVTNKNRLYSVHSTGNSAYCSVVI